jgi:hypothetical protein
VEVRFPPEWASDWNGFAQGIAEAIRDVSPSELKQSNDEKVEAARSRPPELSGSAPAADDAERAAGRAALLEVPE